MKQKLIAQDLHTFSHTFAFGMGEHDAHFACAMASQEWPHTGKAYLTMQKSGSWVDWYDLQVPQEGDYTLIVRYANPDNPAARLVCKGNESGESIRVLEPTAVHFYTKEEDWRHNWKICRFTCTLRAGSNCLRLALGEGCEAPVLLDSLAFTTGTVSAMSGQVYDVRNFGARGDGQTLDTQALVYFQSPEVKGILDRMHEDYRSQDEWWQAMMSARLVEIFIHLSRACQGMEFASPRAEKLPARSEDSLWKIVYYLYRNHDRHLDLAKLGESFNLSIRQIRSLFQKKLGISLQEFILDLRLSNVRSMLENSDINITDIAIGAGFESYRTFVRVFEKQYAISPRDYRKQILSQRVPG